MTRWFARAVTSEGAAPLWWAPYTEPTPMRCVRLGEYFDALVVPTPVALRALETLRAGGRRPGDGEEPGPVADCAAGKAYFLVAADGAGAPAADGLDECEGEGGAPPRRLSTNALLWLPSSRSFREEPVWWLEPPRLTAPSRGAEVRLWDAAALLPLLRKAFHEVAAAV
ncbi:hypothetical protein BIV57_06195 [Mangrovactinospora gilvigrisea]|uniref:Uncharacterized protein n=1 Tax=Mangrovactinospora gilvigrisea TaxID=1428644 RepID=A0A1J7C9R0_9ACTN|nr:hypothetical protein [Mangrovactinospora gilvigrisea]OIV38264.1 hypothetical protein BIV57_06195 [Mangrovactinospora gilvigrisea]